MSDSLPPTPTEAATASLAEGAKDMAQSALMRRVRNFARQKLPRPVYDLIFRGQSTGDVAKDIVRRRIRNLMWGCGFTVVFAGLTGSVLLLVVAIIAGAFLFG